MEKYITLPQDKSPKLTQEDVLKAVAEMSYQSPIEVATRELQTKFEDDAMSVIHSYGICVDKEELVKALQYDRNQYKQGFADGCRVGTSRIRAEVAREIFEEIEKPVALKMPAKITPIFKRDLDYSHGVIDGKREVLFEVLVLIAELKKKYIEN